MSKAGGDRPGRAPPSDQLLASAGAAIGTTVRAAIGTAIGTTVRGATVRATVRTAIGATVRAAIGTTIGATVRATVGTTVRATVGATIGATIGTAVVHTRNSARAAVGRTFCHRTPGSDVLVAQTHELLPSMIVCEPLRPADSAG
ncbi:MAG TPA: hypothetical protein VIU11_04590 [Nakamurella sp.]